MKDMSYGCFFEMVSRCPECDSRYCPEGDCKKQEGWVIIIGMGWVEPERAKRLIEMGYDTA
jgi:hypothetical protein